MGALKIRAAHREGSHALRPGFLPVKEKVSLPIRSESEDLFEKDDKNPDVVPANKGRYFYTWYLYNDVRYKVYSCGFLGVVKGLFLRRST